MGNKNGIYTILGIKLKDYSSEKSYIQNSKLIKDLIHEKYEFVNNYRAIDLLNFYFDTSKQSKNNQKNNNKDIVKKSSDNTELNTSIKYTKEDFLKEVVFLDEDYDKLIALLKRKKNIILQGSPGVGKTFIAKRLAYAFMGVKDEKRVEFIQFHQSYSYEDFIQGYKPNKEGFELKNGVFHEFCKKARDDLDNDYFFIIDEINRGNISKIFGELMMLIEDDKRGEDFAIPLTYSDEGDKFYVPKNVYIIGLMNTADRSLAIIDYALRRRFLFYNMKPLFDNDSKNGGIFKKHLRKNGVSEYLSDKIISNFKNLNETISKDSDLGDGFKIGHSYFCGEFEGDEDEWYKSIIEYEIKPLLLQYWFDNSDKVDEEIKKLE
jgi:MoxR-like ATPase